MTAQEPLRVHALWFPDWPLRAALGEPPPHPPVALVRGNVVTACTASARAHGVRAGQRRRLAQGRMPQLRLLPHDEAQEDRAFLPVLRLIDEHSPGVLLIRPGLAALRSRGVSRYHGGEEEAALALLRMLAEAGYPEVRVGIADGVFTAELAARASAAADGPPWATVPPGGAREFLAPLPVQVLDDEELTGLLLRLGVTTLGGFAALGADQVRTRFGEHGARLHALARGADSRPLSPRPPDPELAREIAFDTPLGQADQIAFAVRQTADAVLLALADASAVCTEVRIDLTDDDGRVHSRTWLHPTCFDAADLVDRVRWQLEALVSDVPDDDAAHAFHGIVGVRIVPVAVDDAAHHQPGLFGAGTDERLHHAVSRVQTLLGHRGVVTASVAGGRLLADRQVLTPWGERPVTERDPSQPWPGRLPGPLPAEVFVPPRPIRVTAAGGEKIRVDARGALSAPPAFIDDCQVAGWAGPWPIREHRWDPDRALDAHRFQLLDAHQRAWLVMLADGRWWAEGRYR
ncbi:MULTISPECIES: DNA polymerase Y family protein [Microbacterium]|uniref:DNA polymerase Y family protein n=1 Tax=Microbacterium TaxID=33882 RepID=UPI00217E0372|nr:MULTISPECIES: DNA polymerase Y family protein [Microbacterium]UWF76801.1 DNA polymerase Y family protein [Microbacterium neungamense]WCM54952.1 DNA polymerase Y family protein [Microbacterium sp. EF45047]